jgi:hypothetical protein
MQKSTNHYLVLSYLYFANEGIKIKAIPESPKINNSGAPCRCNNLNKTASMVMELKSAPEINATFFIVLILVVFKDNAGFFSLVPGAVCQVPLHLSSIANPFFFA